MTLSERGKMISRIVSTLKIACDTLNKTNPYRVRSFSTGDTFFSLAFMTDKDLIRIDRKL